MVNNRPVALSAKPIKALADVGDYAIQAVLAEPAAAQEGPEVPDLASSRRGDDEGEGPEHQAGVEA